MLTDSTASIPMRTISPSAAARTIAASRTVSWLGGFPSIGAALRFARGRAGLSVEELGAALGITEAEVLAFERDEAADVFGDHVRAVLDACGLDASGEPPRSSAWPPPVDSEGVAVWRARRHQRMSRRELGERLGVGPGAIAAIEGGAIRITPHFARALWPALGL